MVPIARRNLLAERARLAVSVSGVGLAILLIAVVLALYRGWSQAGGTIADLPGDLWVVQAGTVDPFHSVSLLNEDEAMSQLSEMPGVKQATPILARRMEMDVRGSTTSAYLMALSTDRDRAPADTRSRYLPERGTLLIDHKFHRKSGLSEGDKLSIGTIELTLGPVRSGSVEPLTEFVFLNYADAQELFAIPGAVNYVVLTLEDGASSASVEKEVAGLGPDYQVFTREEFARSIRKEIDESFIPIILVLVAIGFVVGAAVVGLTLYTATIERSREYAVLRAVGADAPFLYRIVLSQSLIVTGVGFLLGTAAARVVSAAAEQLAPDFTTRFQWTDTTGILLATILMGLIASLIPLRRITGVDPATVFRA